MDMSPISVDVSFALSTRLFIVFLVVYPLASVFVVEQRRGRRTALSLGFIYASLVPGMAGILAAWLGLLRVADVIPLLQSPGRSARAAGIAEAHVPIILGSFIGVFVVLVALLRLRRDPTAQGYLAIPGALCFTVSAALTLPFGWWLLHVPTAAHARDGVFAGGAVAMTALLVIMGSAVRRRSVPVTWHPVLLVIVAYAVVAICSWRMLRVYEAVALGLRNA